MVQKMMSVSSSFSQLLEEFNKGLDRRYIRLENDKANWHLYFDTDSLVYATNSLQSLERLERHLKRIARGNYEGVEPLKPWMRLQLNAFYEQEDKSWLAPDYQSIHWLYTQKILSAKVASLLVQRISLEVLEAALLWNDLNWQYTIELVRDSDTLPTFEKIKVNSIFDQVYERLNNWQQLGKTICSPYQRPYFSSNQQAVRRMSVETLEKLTRLLKGFNFRQLSALLNQDELVVAKRLSPLVKEGVIVLRDPEPPYHDLAYTSNLAALFANVEPDPEDSPQKSLISSRSKPIGLKETEVLNLPDALPQKPKKSDERAGSEDPSGDLKNMMVDVAPTQVWKVVCVDDSEAMLQEISRLLDNQNLQITTVSDPTKALMQICTIVPDIVLLDVGMPHIDGYQICQLIRKVPRLKDMPIVMVTGNKGLVDRAKARFSGATDYLTKPFDHQELIAMVFRYLS